MDLLTQLNAAELVGLSHDLSSLKTLHQAHDAVMTKS